MASDLSWQEEIHKQLVERNVRDTSYASIFEQYRRLAQQARLLKERNQTLLRVVNAANASASSGGGGDNAVRAAYAAMEQQISSLEKEKGELLSEMNKTLKTASSNQERVVEMSDKLLSTERAGRLQSEELRRAKEELEKVKKELTGVKLNLGEKERFIQELTDDNNALSLELTQSAARNDSLKRDNAELLQRWLDLKNEEVSRMNEVNEFYEDMRTQARARSPRDAYRSSVNGDGAESATDGLPASGGGSPLLESGFREAGRPEGRKPGAGRERENG